jgi:cytochrome c5
MIFLFVLAMSAMAEEPEDRSETIYKIFCVNCHGESLEKVPLKPDSTTEQRIDAINTGIKNMPPYNWILNDDEVAKLVKFMERK